MSLTLICILHHNHIKINLQFVGDRLKNSSKTVRLMLPDRCTVCPVSACLSILSVCDVNLLWPNGWMDHDETWRADRPRPWPHCVRWGPSSPPQKGGVAPQLSAHLLWPNGWMDQNATWQGGRPWPRPHSVRWGHSSPFPKGGGAPNFWPISVVAKWPDGSRCHLVGR